jgi:hypothetical protein
MHKTLFQGEIAEMVKNHMAIFIWHVFGDAGF